tara:strand:+ start:173 stop:670 length:498 start_codon:yes stop_codon:yes gene_type:complete
MTIWKWVDEYDKSYRIYKTGKVVSFKGKKPRILKQPINSVGYKCVYLYHKNKRKCFKIHRLIGIYFIKNPKKNPCIDHIDGNKLNNKIENLRWATYLENNNNAKNYGKYLRGVYWMKHRDKFAAKYFCLKKRKTIQIGSFENENDAHEHYVDYYFKQRGVYPCSR